MHGDFANSEQLRRMFHPENAVAGMGPVYPQFRVNLTPRIPTDNRYYSFYFDGFDPLTYPVARAGDQRHGLRVSLEFCYLYWSTYYSNMVESTQGGYCK